MPAETVHHPSQSSATEKPRFVAGKDGIEDDAPVESFEKANPIEAGVQVDTHEKALELIVPAVERAEDAAERANSRIDAIEIQLELLNREREARDSLEQKGGLADDQPRRIRKQDGVTEKLVKYADNSFGWQVVSVDADAMSTNVSQEKASNETKPGTDVEVHGKDAIDAEIVDEEDIIDAEVVDDGSDVWVNRSLDLEEPVDMGELKVIDAAPERLAIEAAPKAEFAPSSESYKSVLDAMEKYAEITAGKRNGYLGHFLEKSKWLVKIPGMQKLGDWANDKADAKVREARGEYETATRGMMDELKQFQVEQEVEDSKERRAEVRAEKLKQLTDMDTALELSIVAKQLEASGKGAITGKFVDWWVQQEDLGWKGSLKKALAVAAVGGAIGLGVGALGLSLPGLAVGAVAGAAAGGGLMANVTKRRAGGLTASGETLADARSNEDMEAKQQAAEDINTESLDVSDFTNIVEERTRDEQIRNRSRINKGKGVGALAGGLGSGVGGAIREGINGIANAAPQPPTAETPTATKAVGVEVPKAPEFQGLNFDVQSGSGYTQELMDFAQANGHALNPDQSWQLHQDIMNQFGQDYININGDGSDIYTDGGDVRLTETGSGEWAPGVADYIKNWMAARSLW